MTDDQRLARRHARNARSADAADRRRRRVREIVGEAVAERARAVARGDVGAAYDSGGDEAARRVVVGTALPLAYGGLIARLEEADRSAIRETFAIARWLQVSPSVVVGVMLGRLGVSDEAELAALVERARAADGVTDEQAQMRCADYLAACARRGDLSSDARRLLVDALAAGLNDASAAPEGGVGDAPPGAPL